MADNNENKKNENFIRAEWVSNIYNLCKVGEQVYGDLKKDLPENTKLVFIPEGIENLVWILSFARDFKKRYDCALWLALEDKYKDIAVLFPEIDYIIPLDQQVSLALRSYIVLNERWQDSSFFYGYRQEEYGYNDDDKQFFIHWLPCGNVYMEYGQMIRKSLGIPIDSKASPAYIPELQAEYRQVFSRSVFLVPGSEKGREDIVPLSFWLKLGKKLQNIGLIVYVHKESMPEGMDEDVFSTIECNMAEFAQIAKVMRLCVAARTGWCALLAVSSANIVTIYPEKFEDEDIYQPRVLPPDVMSNEGKNSFDASLRDNIKEIGIDGQILNEQYSSEKEEELINRIIERVGYE